MDSSFIQCPLPRNKVSLTNAFGILVVLCCIIFVTSPPAACLQADLFIAVRSLWWALFKVYCYKNSCRRQRGKQREEIAYVRTQMSKQFCRERQHAYAKLRLFICS